ncbi:MAG: HAMP domain-containing protein [bacterium]|nr:HAMP domain-containing protein [bacterium]
MKIISIYQKLVAFATGILLTAMSVLFIINSLLIFIDLQTRLGRIESDMRGILVDKGKHLALYNSRALPDMMDENRIIGIADMMEFHVEKDDDVVYGVLMLPDRKPWFINGDYPYAPPTATRHGSTLHYTSEVASLDDPQSKWAHDVSDDIGFNEVNSGDYVVFEFVAPLTSEGDQVGTIRYGITTDSMRRDIESAKSDAFKRSLINSALLILVGMVVFFVFNRLAHRRANSITQPLGKLTRAADAVSKGDYSLPIDVSSNDEVAVLAESFETMRATIREHTENLEDKVKQRTRQLETAQKELVEQAHKSGMADIATAVLHNIGNILNSAMTSSEQIKEILNSSGFSGLQKANQLVRTNIDNIEHFILNDSRGPKLLQYYLAVEEMLSDEQNTLVRHSERLMLKISAIRDVILAQQSYASAGRSAEEVRLADIIEDTLCLQEGAIARHNMHVVKELHDVPPLYLQRVKLMQVVLNLFKNAKEAMVELPANEKIMTVSLYREKGHAYIKVKDSGCGIPAEHAKKIFSHGFTTKPDGHGFGLHSCANYMVEMGGKIMVKSDGEGRGAIFTLQFELPEKERET